MKCVCGYEYLTEETDHDSREVIQKETERFIELNCHVTIEVEMRMGTGIEKVNLLACPKCGTVRMERWY